MYLPFFGFSEKPFNLTPDPRFLFLSEKHKEALGHLLYGIRERKGFIVITGEVGTGKTILSRALLHELTKDEGINTALILNPSLSELELLKTINEEFGIPIRSDTKKELIDELHNFLLEGLQAGKNAVLVIDEAQNLAPSVLEQIRLLSNLETEKEKLLQIVLVGQSELEANLQLPRLRQLNQRITVRFRLRPLDFKESRHYIYHRLALADGLDKVRFTRLALENIFRHTQGNPRRINILTDRVLLAAYIRATRKITGSIVKKTVREVKEHVAPYQEKSSSPRQLFYPSLVIILLLLSLTGFYLYRDKLAPLFSQSDSATDSSLMSPDRPPESTPTATQPGSPPESALTSLKSPEKTGVIDLKTKHPYPEGGSNFAKERDSNEDLETLLPKVAEGPKLPEGASNLGKLPSTERGQGNSTDFLSKESGEGGPLETFADKNKQGSPEGDFTVSSLPPDGEAEVMVHPPTLILPHQGGGGSAGMRYIPSPLMGEGQGEGGAEQLQAKDPSSAGGDTLPEGTAPKEARRNGLQKSENDTGQVQPSRRIAPLLPLKENLEWLRQRDGFTKNLKLMARAFGFYIEEIETASKILEIFKTPFFIELSSPNENDEYFLLLDRPGSSGAVVVYSAGSGETEYSKEELEKLWNKKALIPVKQSKELEENLPLLKFGMRGEQVSALQAGLKELTYLPEAVTGTYDFNTLRAVKEFQRDYHLQVDGYVGPRTKLLLFLATGRI